MTKSLGMIAGALATRLPQDVTVIQTRPGEWRQQVGLPGNASKDEVSQFVVRHKLASIGDGRDVSHVPLGAVPMPHGVPWSQDACDAYCIALAVRRLNNDAIARTA